MNPVLPPLGETRKETVSQGRGVSVSLSGGDEQCEPESVHSSALHGRCPNLPNNDSRTNQW
jgi:hypothetical protein